MNKKYFRLVKVIGLVTIIFLLAFFAYRYISNLNNPKPIDSQNTSDQSSVKYTDFHLEIPSINIDAPIIPDVEGSDKEAYFSALQKGVAHYANTKKPGEGGNIFIFGHSSYYIWDKGKYKQIFKELDQVKTNDKINVYYQNKLYVYTVTETKIVKPNDVSVLEPTENEQLTLMTCYPPGTIEKRLIVIAKPLK